MGATFASFRDSNDNATYVVSGGSSTTNATNLWYSIAFSNLAGFNKGSALQQVSVGAGQQLEVQLPLSLLGTGERPERIYLMAAPADDPAQRRTIAYADTRNTDGTLVSTISSIILDADEHFLLDESVADPAALTALTDILPGMRRQLVSTGFVYQYEPDSTEIVDDTLTISASIGRWVRVSSFLSDIVDTTSVGGSDQTLLTINALDRPQDLVYPFDGSLGRTVGYWYINTQGATLQRGTRLGLQVLLNLKAYSNLFKDKVVITFVGYVDQSTGVLDTSMSGAGSSYHWDPQDINQLVLTSDLPVGSAAYYEIALEADIADFGGTLTPASELSFYLFPQPLSAVSAPFTIFTGDVVAPGSDLRLIVPGTGLTANGLSGQVAVDGLISTVGVLTPISGLLSNTANQLVITDGTGLLEIEQSGYVIPDVEAQRAVVSTLAGTGTAVDVGQIVLGATGGIELEIDHPVNTDNEGTIRLNYPDPLLAGLGNKEGIVFNPNSVTIYLDDGTDVYEAASFPVLTQPNQTVSVTSIGTIDALPNPANDFSLYSANGAGLSTVSGSIPAGTYQVYVAYTYTGNQVTRISHAVGDGNIPTFQSGFSDLLALAQCFGCAEVDYQALRDKTDIPPYFLTTVQPNGTSTGDQEIWTFNPAGVAADNGSSVLTLTTGTGNWVLLATGGGGGGGGGGHTIQDEGVVLTQRTNLNFTGLNLEAQDNAGNDATDIVINGQHEILNEGSSRPARSKLGFNGDLVSVTDNSLADATIVTITTPTPRHLIQDEGSTRTARSNLNFIGAGVTVTDNSGGDTTEVTIPGGSSTDESVKVSANDTTAGFLNGKLIAGTNITLVENNDAGDETLTVNSTGGTQGPAGNDGADGVDGADGKTVLNGTVDPTGADGVDGDFYINTATNTIFGPKAAGVWGSGTSLVGPSGSVTGLILDESTAPSTGADQVAVFVDSADGILKQRAESDGAITVIGSGGSPPTTEDAEAEFYYELEDNTDSSGNGDDLTDVGTPSFASGLINNALSTDGTVGEGLRITDRASNRFGSKDWSFSVWFNLNTVATSVQIIFAKEAANFSSREISLFLSTSDLRILLGEGTSVQENFSILTVAANTWYHVVGTYENSTSTLEVTVNDSKLLTTVLTITPGNSTVDLTIGVRDDGATSDGLIDQFIKFDGILTASQISTLYNGGVGQTNPLTSIGTTSGTFAQTDVANVYTASQNSSTVELTIASGVLAIDSSLSNVFSVELTENITSITISNLPATGGRFDIDFYQDATGGRTVTGWPAAVLWPDGIEPVFTGTASEEDQIVSIFSRDGVTIKGTYTGDTFS